MQARAEGTWLHLDKITGSTNSVVLGNDGCQLITLYRQVALHGFVTSLIKLSLSLLLGEISALFACQPDPYLACGLTASPLSTPRPIPVRVNAWITKHCMISPYDSKPWNSPKTLAIRVPRNLLFNYISSTNQNSYYCLQLSTAVLVCDYTKMLNCLFYEQTMNVNSSKNNRAGNEKANYCKLKSEKFCYTSSNVKIGQAERRELRCKIFLNTYIICRLILRRSSIFCCTLYFKTKMKGSKRKNITLLLFKAG